MSGALAESSVFLELVPRLMSRDLQNLIELTTSHAQTLAQSRNRETVIGLNEGEDSTRRVFGVCQHQRLH